MHVDEVETSPALLQRLLTAQFPEWAGLPIRYVESYGTDHDIYRIGEQLGARLPRIEGAVAQASKEAEWLPRLAPLLPLAIPAPVAIGHPADSYPFEWSICQWLPGENANGTIRDLDQAAVDLAAFVTALRRIDTTGAPRRRPQSRGAPLIELDYDVRRSIRELGERIDANAALRSWEASLAATPWDKPETWLHGDLLPGNLLVVDGQLSAVIDFGGLNVGDPACDLQPAWNVFTGQSRIRYRTELAADDASWQRGRGWTMYQAVTGLAYYWDTNPGMIRQTSHALTELLADGPLTL
jgi:aminoglycoside phosphotransferase (APT) family kinase protein